MTETARSERTARILIGRLEELARALETSGAPHESITRLLEAASVATMHAITLELLSADRARAIWGEAEQRHPAIGAHRQRVAA